MVTLLKAAWTSVTCIAFCFPEFGYIITSVQFIMSEIIITRTSRLLITIPSYHISWSLAFNLTIQLFDVNGSAAILLPLLSYKYNTAISEVDTSTLLTIGWDTGYTFVTAQMAAKWPKAPHHQHDLSSLNTSLCCIGGCIAPQVAAKSSLVLAPGWLNPWPRLGLLLAITCLLYQHLLAWHSASFLASFSALHKFNV